MQNEKTAGGLWPVMLTPFTDTGEVDYFALGALIDWYESNGATGLFAVCQSSEVFYLSLRERVEIASYVKKHASVPVIASGHVSEGLADQKEELQRIEQAGVDAVILITNRLAPEGSPPARWMDTLSALMDTLGKDTPLGFYECPYPYKRLVSTEELHSCGKTGRFQFMKDTCCDIQLIQKRLGILDNSGFGLYNANTATLLDSLRAGAAGFSGVMANFHPDLYDWILRNWRQKPQECTLLQQVLTTCSLIENQLYPVCAKTHLQKLGLPISLYTRSRRHHALTPLIQEEVRQMDALVDWARSILIS